MSLGLLSLYHVLNGILFCLKLIESQPIQCNLWVVGGHRGFCPTDDAEVRPKSLVLEHKRKRELRMLFRLCRLYYRFF